ncbi:MAG: RNA polymerase sigma factor [bacterium]|nr:RNA polymerase sigma factor [bacterium]
MKAKPPLSDIEILKDSQSYPWMFGMLVDRYQEAFLRKGLYILRSRDATEDAVQETFLKIYKYAHQFSERTNASFSSWAYKILTNVCYDLASRQVQEASRTKAMDFGDLDVLGGTDNSLGNDRASFVESVLSRIPHKLSRLLSLRFFEEKTYEEIATLENISLSAVRSGLHRAKKQFKNVAVKMI